VLFVLGSKKPLLYDAEPLVYLTFEKLSNGNVIVKHDPMHGGS
jgi:hypothetical protein